MTDDSRELTDKQTKFLSEIENQMAKTGLICYRECRDLAGYSTGTNPSTIVKGLRKEIKDLVDTKIVLNGLKATEAVIDIMDDPTQLGASNKLKAAKTLLDRIVPTVKEVKEAESKIPNTVIILPTLYSEDAGIKVINKTKGDK